MANNNEMTSSQAKRAARKAAAEKQKKARRNEKIVEYAIYTVVILVVGTIIGAIIAGQMKKVKASDDYSKCLDSNGYILGVVASSAVELPDYKNATVSLSEIEFTEEDIQSDINSQVNAHKLLKEDESIVVADGDEVNIDYVGSVDGVEFEGGSAQGFDLTIGSGTFIEGFEEQLIGAKVKSNFDINVTFPEDYSSEELAGKDAVFNITVNGVEEIPEFTDEFVTEYLSDKASTVEEYKQYLKTTNEENALVAWTESYIEDNSTAKEYKRKYLNNIKSNLKFEAEQGYAEMNQLYMTYLNQPYEGTFEDYLGMSVEEFDASLDETAKEEYKNRLAFQAIVELEGASVDAAYYKDYLSKNGQSVTDYDSLVEQMGEAYVLQQAIKVKAIELVKNMVTVQ